MVVLHEAGVAGDFNPCSYTVAVALYSNRLDGNPMVGSGRSVVQQFGLTPDSRDNDVHFAVIVEVSKSTSSVGRCLRQPSCSAYVCECSTLQITEYRIPLTIVLLGIQV